MKNNIAAIIGIVLLVLCFVFMIQADYVESIFWGKAFPWFSGICGLGFVGSMWWIATQKKK